MAETKESMSSMELREIEKIKIERAMKFWEKINQKVTNDQVKYDVLDGFGIIC